MSTNTRGAAAPYNDLAPECDLLWVVKLSPELGDGDHFELLGGDGDTVPTVLSLIKPWLEEATAGNLAPGESFSVEVARITRAEFNALPEI